MKTELKAVIFQEGGRFLSEIIRIWRPNKREPEHKPIMITEESKELTEKQPVEESKATKVATGCVPCAIGHFGTCTGLLNEAMRFAKKDGLDSSEVIDRANMCLDELNTMERVDLRAEMIAQLPEWEKDLANRALIESRKTRHSLEELSTVEELEATAATTQVARQEIGREWFQRRLAKMEKEE